MALDRPAPLASLGLAALAPVLAYALARSATGYVAVVSVLLIVGSFFKMLSTSGADGSAH
ncbi:hypothetical protein BRC81_15480 [Halobacteriales archaeon QS_1_68_20]|nr:MAG: hypothetical protein BRC81_15480 [Halobacteriales archaeon QS_1_68_20]